MSDETARLPENEDLPPSRADIDGERRVVPPFGTALSLLWWEEADEHARAGD